MKYFFLSFIFCYYILTSVCAQELPTSPWGNRHSQMGDFMSMNTTKTTSDKLPNNPWSNKNYIDSAQKLQTHSSSLENINNGMQSFNSGNKRQFQRQQRAASSGNLHETFRLTTRRDSYHKQGGKVAKKSKSSGFKNTLNGFKTLPSTQTTTFSLPSETPVDTDSFNDYLKDTLHIIKKGGTDARKLFNNI